MRTLIPVCVAVVALLCADVARSAGSPTVRISEVRELAVGEPVVVGGEIRARTDLVLPATLEGELTWVAEEGTELDAGGVVARVDDRQLGLQRREQELLAERAAINLDYLTKEVERLQALQQSNLASRTQLAEMVSRRDTAANDLAVARSRIAQLDEQLARTEIKSPVDAMVVERRIAGGEYARRGDGVVRVVDPHDLEVVITIPLTYLGRVEARARVTIEAGGRVFAAHVRSLIRAGSASSQTFIALADVPVEAASHLMTGQLAEVSVPLSQGRTSLFVPRDAVVLRADGSYVYRIDEGNVATRVTVDLGEGQGDLVSVTGELRAGDRIAVRGVERLADGQTVTPIQT